MSTTVAANGTNLGVKGATMVAVRRAAAAAMTRTKTGDPLGGKTARGAGKSMTVTTGVVLVGGTGVPHHHPRDLEEQSGRCGINSN